MKNHIAELIEIKDTMQYASYDIYDYDDESETLQYHSEALSEAADKLAQIIAEMREPKKDYVKS